MKPDPTKLLEIACIKTPIIGFYDVSDPKPFRPFAKPKRCYFSSYENWLKGDSVCISTNESSCRGGGYWVGGVEFTTRENFAKVLNQREGFKSSDELMCQWLENLKPYMIENGYVMIGPLKEDQYEHLAMVLAGPAGSVRTSPSILGANRSQLAPPTVTLQIKARRLSSVRRTSSNRDRTSGQSYSFSRASWRRKKS
jgi:hypothetical protein